MRELVIDGAGLHVGMVLPNFGGLTHDGVPQPGAGDAPAPRGKPDGPPRT
jgi:hypothetical protein